MLGSNNERAGRPAATRPYSPPSKQRENDIIFSNKLNEPFTDHRAAARACFNASDNLTRRAGQFLGGIAHDGTPLSPAQREWLDQLLERAGLPPLIEQVL